MPEASSGLWEAVRRALGRLVSSVQVQDLPPGDLAPALRLFGAETLSVPVCGPGPQESTWAPRALTTGMPPPAAHSGAGGADLATVTVSFGLNGAFSDGAARVQEAQVRDHVVVIHRQDFWNRQAQTLVIQDASVALAPAGSTAAQARVPPAAVAGLPTDAPSFPVKPASHRRKTGDERDGHGAELAFSNIRVRTGLAVCGEVPLVRGRRPPPPGLRMAQAFAEERRQLARSSQIDLEDVILFGVYPQVPVAAVRRLALEEEGRTLSLWLKPEALEAAARGKVPRLATLIVGRQRSTGRMIQAVA